MAAIVIAKVLFMLVMVEVVRLLVVSLEEHRVAVDFLGELGIVATLVPHRRDERVPPGARRAAPLATPRTDLSQPLTGRTQADG